jgi:hypothetical protein
MPVYPGAVAVGTNIAARPPHRSVRAELPHTAPALDFGVRRQSLRRTHCSWHLETWNPALSPARAHTLAILLSPRPSLHHLRGFSSQVKRCSATSSVVRRSPTPRRRACGPYDYCLHPPTCRDDSLQAPPRSAGSRVWSFQTCIESATTQGRPPTRVNAAGRVAFRPWWTMSAP